MTLGLLDTSVVIEGDRHSVPDAAAVSVITLGELRAGILLARDPMKRAHRSRRLLALQSAFAVFDVDSRVADHYGEIRAFAKTERRLLDSTDLLILATAAAHGLTLHTLDDKQARLALDLGLPVERG
jgi:predicted nucleic acid-binding protein